MRQFFARASAGMALAMLVAAARITAPCYADTPAEAGSVLVMRGTCYVTSDNVKAALKPDDIVHLGDTIAVPTGAKIKLQMIDGSVISLASGSTLTIRTYDIDKASDHRDAMLSMAGGLLHAVVSKVTQPSTFEVTTATGVAAVRSTDWFIEAQPTITKVGVLRGVVVLTSVATGHSMKIPGRWGSHVEAGKDPTPARLWSKAEFDDVIRRTALN